MRPLPGFWRRGQAPRGYHPGRGLNPGRCGGGLRRPPESQTAVVEVSMLPRTAVLGVVARFVQYIPTCVAVMVLRRRDANECARKSRETEEAKEKVWQATAVCEETAVCEGAIEYGDWLERCAGDFSSGRR